MVAVYVLNVPVSMVLLLTLLSQIFLHEIPTVSDVSAVGVPAAGVPFACGAIGGVPAACLPGVWLLLTSPLLVKCRPRCSRPPAVIDFPLLQLSLLFPASLLLQTFLLFLAM
jgi:hypothetical protein